MRFGNDSQKIALVVMLPLLVVEGLTSTPIPRFRDTRLQFQLQCRNEWSENFSCSYTQ